MKNFILEGCVDSVESAISASQGGANRLELCSNLIIGGTTPSPCLFTQIKKLCKTKIHVLIRPRYGDFCYSDYEYKTIKEEICMFNQLGADGIVIGILKPDGNLDIDRLEKLIELAKNMSITLHRAFDVCVNPFEALAQAKQLNIQTILTSGQKNSCLEGKELISELVKKSEGKIDILVAGGVNAKVIKQLYPFTKATSYHMSGKIIKDSAMIYQKKEVSMGLPSFSEYQIWQTQKEAIQNAYHTLELFLSKTNTQE